MATEVLGKKTLPKGQKDDRCAARSNADALRSTVVFKSTLSKKRSHHVKGHKVTKNCPILFTFDLRSLGLLKDVLSRRKCCVM